MSPQGSPPPYAHAAGIMRGAFIACEDGEVAIEAVKTGDIVNTLSDGPQVVRWVGMASTRPAAVRFDIGALGETMPRQPLLVTPAQRMVLSGWQTKVLFGESEVLVAAEALLNDQDITLSEARDGFESFHILFDKHEILQVNGAASESFYPSKAALGTLPAEARSALLAQCPELGPQDPNHPFDLVRPKISAAEAALLR